MEEGRRRGRTVGEFPQCERRGVPELFGSGDRERDEDDQHESSKHE